MDAGDPGWLGFGWWGVEHRRPVGERGARATPRRTAAVRPLSGAGFQHRGADERCRTTRSAAYVQALRRTGRRRRGNPDLRGPAGRWRRGADPGPVARCADPRRQRRHLQSQDEQRAQGARGRRPPGRGAVRCGHRARPGRSAAGPRPPWRPGRGSCWRSRRPKRREASRPRSNAPISTGTRRGSCSPPIGWALRWHPAASRCCRGIRCERHRQLARLQPLDRRRLFGRPLGARTGPRDLPGRCHAAAAARQRGRGPTVWRRQVRWARTRLRLPVWPLVLWEPVIGWAASGAAGRSAFSVLGANAAVIVVAGWSSIRSAWLVGREMVHDGAWPVVRDAGGGGGAAARGPGAGADRKCALGPDDLLAGDRFGRPVAGNLPGADEGCRSGKSV